MICEENSALYFLGNVVQGQQELFFQMCQKRISVPMANPRDSLSSHFLLRSASQILGQSSPPGMQEEEDDRGR